MVSMSLMPRTESHRRPTLGVQLVVMALLAGCTGDRGAEPTGAMVQDSSGVAIVMNSGPGSWGPSGAWGLRKTLRIDPDESDADRLFEQIVGIDASRDGRFVVVDGGASRVHTFGPEGEAIASFGRVGSGPGEFPAMTLMLSSRRVVVDSLERINIPGVDGRLSVFSWTGDLVDLKTPEPGLTSVMGWVRSEAGLVLKEVLAMTLSADGSPPAFAQTIFRRDGDGAVRRVVDLPARRPPEATSAGVARMEAFGPIPVWTVQSESYVAVALPQEYSIKVCDLEGNLVRVIRRDVPGEAVTARDREAFLNSHREILERGGSPESLIKQMEQGISFPDRWPVLGQLLGGPDETLWVQRIDRNLAVERANWGEAFMGGLPGLEWDVFDWEGQFLGSVRMPEGFRPFQFRGEDLYGVGEDTFGVQSIVRLALER